MFEGTLLGISLLLLLAAAGLALRLIPLSGKWHTWICIAAALLLMILRRMTILFRLMAGEHVPLDPFGETLGVVVGVLMVIGFGGLRAVFLSLKDTTEKLRQSDKVLRLMLDQLPTILWTTDVDLRCTSVTGSGIAALGVTPSQVVGLTLQEYLQTRDIARPSIAASLEAVRGTAGTFSGELQGRTLECRVEPFRDSTGRIVGTIGVAHDITPHRTALNALEQSEERLRTAIEAAPLPIIILAEDGHVEDVNGVWCELTGYSRSELTTIAAWTERAYGERKEIVQATIEKLFEAGSRVSEGEFEIRTLGGDHRTWDFYSAPLGKKADGTRLVISMASDVTARKAAEAALQQTLATLEVRVRERTTELQATNAKLMAEQTSLRRLYELLDQERRIISYEIHDGLVQFATGAKMQCEALCESPAGEPVREKLQTITEMLRQAICEGRSLVNGLRPASLDDFGLLAGINEFVQGLNSGLAVTFTHQGDFERLAPILENSVYRIVQESLTNAARYSHGKQIDVRLELRGERVCVEIKDDGAGFDAGVIPDGHYGIRGIQERARVFGGSVQIDTAPGQGTRIAVELPLVQMA